MADQVFLRLLTFVLFILGANAWRCAKYEHYFSQQPDYIECLWDCCGNSFNRHCCAPIGIIVGVCIVSAVAVALVIVFLICWYQTRRSQYSKGPKRFHNRHHSHYPVAPTSVTRPAPPVSYGGSDQGFKPLPGPGYGPASTYRPRPAGPPLTSEKPPIDDFYDVKTAPSPGGYRPSPPADVYRDSPPRDGKPPVDYFPGESAVDI